MAAASRCRILVVEDEWLLAEHIQEALQHWGFEVIGPAGRVEQALALLKDDKVDAAVLDINLHGERSFRVAERLAQTGTPFIFLSGYTEAEIPPNFREGQLMTKPVDTNILCQCLDALLTPSP